MAVKQVFNTSAELDFPNVLPTLDLDFANSKTLDPRITFTRASGGSYVGADGLIKYAGVNEARFDHDPVTGESLGLLIEESRQNKLLRSEQWWLGSFGNGWRSGGGFFEEIVTDYHPRRGDIEVLKFGPPEDVSSFSNSICNQVITLGPAGTYTAYADYKAVGRTTTVRFLHAPIDGSGDGNVGGVLRLFGNGGVNNVNFIPGTTFGEQLYLDSIPLGNGWYRCIVIFTTIREVGDFRFRGFPYIGNQALIGDSIRSGLLGTMAQLEQGSFPTSYIPTQASTRTRAADNASITGKNFSEWYRPDEGTLFCSGIVTVPQRNIGIIKIRNSSLGGNTGIGFQMDTRTGNKYISFRTRNRIFGNNLFPGVNTADAFKKFKGSGSFNLLNNVTLASFDGLNCPPNFTYIENTENILEIGSPSVIGGTSSNPFNGTISKFTYYTRALSQSQLQALTS